jgi:hypothetical protein
VEQTRADACLIITYFLAYQSAHKLGTATVEANISELRKIVQQQKNKTRQLKGINKMKETRYI